MGNTPNKTLELIKKYDFSIQKKYGQNFLVDSNILEAIVNGAGITKEDTVLEIGPGLGALTSYLCESAKKVIAVEVDKMLIPILKDTLKEYDNLELINDDILKVDIASLAKDVPEGIKVVANLPYYITTPIVMELLEKEINIASITVMVQKEVAERMKDGPGTKSYGALSLAVQYYSNPEILFTVSKNCFIPRPNVDSAVIKLDIYKPEERPVKISNPNQMFKIIRASFNQRRKTLVNALGNASELGYDKYDIAMALRKMQFSVNVRGEALTLENFAELTRRLTEGDF